MELTQLPPWKRHIGYAVLFLAGYAIVRSIATTITILREVGDPFDVWGDDDD